MHRQSATSSVEVLPEVLVWAPNGDENEVAAGTRAVQAQELCARGAQPGEAGAAYMVRHYSKEAYSHAFGPLGIGSLLRFCQALDVELQNVATHGQLILTTLPANQESRANAAVLLGAWLVLKRGWSADAVVQCLGHKEAEVKFACSWNRSADDQDREMCVAHCWQGMEAARSRGWLDPAMLEDAAKIDGMCSEILTLSAMFDVAWLIPGFLMIGADPMTTIVDPNPITCSQLLPDGHEADRKEDNGENEVAATPKSMTSVNSVDTVCKEYDFSGTAMSGGQVRATDDWPTDFTTLFQQMGIGLVVRANFDDEPGMTKGYSDGAFASHGLLQANIRVVDKLGGLPTPHDVARLLEVGEGFMHEKGHAVMIHCKGGFGRSVVLAACLAIDKFHISGAAALVFFRIMRPGAITSSKQERFLKSLKTSDDLRRFANLPMAGDGGNTMSRVTSLRSLLGRCCSPSL